MRGCFLPSPHALFAWWGGVGGGGHFYGSNNDLKNAFNIFQHVVIPKSQNAITLSVQKSSPLLIREALRVLTSIDLDHDARRVTREVCEEGAYCRLTTEMSIRKMTKTLPKFALGIGRVLAKLASARDALIRFANC